MLAIRGLLIGVVGAALCCGCAKTPYQLKQEYQAKQAERLRPAQLEHDSGEWRALRSMRVRVYLDAAATRGGARGDFEERLVRVNQVLASALGVRLLLEEVRELPAQQPPGSDTDAALVALEQLDPAKDVDFVVAVIGASPVVTLSFHELGRARGLGKHIVVRTMDDVAELRALEGFDTLDATERSRLYQQRKRHKESTVLLHELGHALGAAHTNDALELMHPAYDNEMQGFGPQNRELMGYVVDARLAEGGAADMRALYQSIADALKRSEAGVFVDADRQRYLAELEQAIASGAVSIDEGAAAAAPAPERAAPEEDLSALSEADRTRYRAIDGAVQAQRWAEVRTSMMELARSYPESLLVQQKACQLGMQLGLPHHELKPYCDRMMALSMQPAAH